MKKPPTKAALDVAYEGIEMITNSASANHAERLASIIDERTDSLIVTRLLEVLDGALEKSEYASVSVGIAAFNTSLARDVVFRIVSGETLIAAEGKNFDEAKEKLK